MQMQSAEKRPSGRGRGFFRKSCAVAALAACLFTASCTSKAVKRTNLMDDSFRKGDYMALVNDVLSNEKLYGETNAFLFHMDLGVLYHYVGQYGESNKHLQKAAEIYDDLFTRSVSNEAAALLTNDNVRPYRAKPYELIFLHQIAAFNFMAEGKFDEALVESRRAQTRFNEWERTVAKDGKYHTDGMFHLFSSLAYEKINEPDNSLISLYKSVDAYKKGPVELPGEVQGFAYDRLKAGDREEDIGRLGISRSDPGSWTAKQGQAEIIIVGYAGRGPNLKEQNWSGTYVNGGDLYITAPPAFKGGSPRTYRVPAPMLPTGHNNERDGGTFHIKLSLPELRTFPSMTSRFEARTGGAAFESVVVNDVDLQAQKALDDAWGEIVGRMAVRVIVRTIAAQQTKSRVDTGSPLGNLALNLSVDVASDQMEKADVRMCFLLPRRVHVIRIPAEPGAHSVELRSYDKYGSVIDSETYGDVQVKRGEKKVLIYNSLY
jgi:hypothetical protein